MEREAADGHVEKRSIRDDALPLALVHARVAVLAPDRFGRSQDRDATIRLLLASLLEVPNHGVRRRRFPGRLRGVIVEQAEIRSESAGNAGDHLVDREVIERVEEPQAIAADRPTEIGMAFPECEVRIAGESARRQVGR